MTNKHDAGSHTLNPWEDNYFCLFTSLTNLKKCLVTSIWLFFHLYINFFIHTHTHTHTHTYIHTHPYIYIYIYTHTYSHTCIYTHACIYIHTQIYISIHTHTHTYIYILGWVKYFAIFWYMLGCGVYITWLKQFKFR